MIPSCFIGVTVAGNIFVCVFVMLPLGYQLAIRSGLGLVGLWLAMSISWLLATFVYLYIVVCTDWQQQAEEAKMCTQGLRRPRPRPRVLLRLHFLSLVLFLGPLHSHSQEEV